MLAENLFPLTAALVMVAAAALLGALLLWRRVSAAQAGLARVATSLDERALTLPLALWSTRAALAERAAAVEHANWMLTRFDERADNLIGSMARGRAGLDAAGARLEGARGNVERLKSTARLIMRAIELRRAFLG
ncbi:MAG: hypothetical protein ACR2H0_01460 [Candidatus Limnocylindrales bacterium]